MSRSEAPPAPVPLGLKIAMTAFVAVLVPIYWRANGVLHFLWISDVALFLTLVALWRESPLLNSLVALGALPFETAWLVDFLGQLILGMESYGVADYMFDEDLSLVLRGLSLFHLPLPIIWVWLLIRWGYDRRALKPLIPGFAILILLTYGLTDPEGNINFVFSPQVEGWTWISQVSWLALYLIALPLLWFWPAHAVLKQFWPREAVTSGRR